MLRPIYLDYMATTPVDHDVTVMMQRCLELEGEFGNSASNTHAYGFQAKELVDKARLQVANAVGADVREIIWTSGATESNNLAIKGTAAFYQRQGRHIITMATEHKAVLDTCKFLRTQGFRVTTLKPQANGLLDLNQLVEAITPETTLISIMHVNNETGVIQDIEAIGHIARKQGIKFHVDAAQSIGKTQLNLNALPVDLASFSAHKSYGPKGVGALYIARQPRVRLQPLQHGGQHEQGLRSGTIPTHQVVGMGAAFALVSNDFVRSDTKIRELSNQFWQGLAAIPGVTLNTEAKPRVPHCLSVRIEAVDAEALLVSLRKLAISTGSACNSANPEPSHVLLAMGLSRFEAQSSLRISLGRYTSAEDVQIAVQHIEQEVQRLRKASSIWGRAKQRVKPNHNND